MGYQGLKWLKCDLHMHNPMDNNWAGARVADPAAMAKEFADACYASRLDVIGMASHSYEGLQFYPYLNKALHDLEQKEGHKITLFPGFEITTSIGLGVHIVCLFEPGTENLDHILTSIGADATLIGSKQSTKVQKHLSEILHDVQKRYHGIVILAHVFDKHGLLDESSYPDDFASDDFRIPDLLAVEVHKPVSKMSQNFQRLFNSGDTCDDKWRRDFPIATIMSSDCKQLLAQTEHGKPKPNSVNYRYTWIKMSCQSIESLKQAFLDHNSRILLSEKHPNLSIEHPYIVSIKIENSKFLEDQEVFFSPNLNCIIGGRGSGKSSLIEYLRLSFRKDDGKEIEDDEKTKNRIERIKNTLIHENSTGRIVATWQGARGVQDIVIWENGISFPYENQENVDTFFKGISASFFSQQQLTHMTAAEKYDDNKQQAQRLQDLIDGFFPDKMREFERNEESVKSVIHDAFNAQRSIRTIEKEHSELLQELSSLIKQCNARQELQDPAKRHQLLSYEKKVLDALKISPFQQLEAWAIETEKIASGKTSTSTIQLQIEGNTIPHGTELRNAEIYVNQIMADTAKNIMLWCQDFNSKLSVYMATQPWPSISSELDFADREFEDKLAQKGLTRDDITRLQTLLDSRKNLEEKLEEKRKTIEQRKSTADSPDELLCKLYEIWRQQFYMRKRAVAMANEHTSGGEKAYKIIEVVASYQADNKDFLEQWDSISPNRTERLGRTWFDIGNRIFSEFLSSRVNLESSADSAQTGIFDSPWQLIQQELLNQDNAAILRWIARNDTDLPIIFREHFQKLDEHWERLRCSRIKDSIDLTLFRADSSQAGMISKSTLSDGQRNTAALVLLLSQAESGPLIIDQPEEELDSEFIYNELLPLLREKKNSRQLIFATHNANLPVNGDSELVYAFEARENKGKCLAQGGLDKKGVADAILKVMEGSAEAFQRRKNKYHF